MTTVRVYDHVYDQHGRPVPAALVRILDSLAALVTYIGANPIATDSRGYWQADLEPGTYTLIISKGTASITRELIVCSPAASSDYGIIAGGWTNSIATAATNRAEYIHLASASNATDFGTSHGVVHAAGSGVGNAVQALHQIGQTNIGSTWTFALGYFQFASLANSAGGSALEVSHAYRCAHGNSVRGLWFGGTTASTTNPNTTISYSDMATLGGGAGIGFGNLSAAARFSAAAGGNTTRALCLGGVASSSGVTLTASIQYVEIASLGNGAAFGSLTAARGYHGAASGSTKVIAAGGYTPNASTIANCVASSEFVTTASLADAASWGNLSTASDGMAGCSDKIRGAFQGGRSAAGVINAIDYFTFASAGAAASFGTLSMARFDAAGMSSNGGGI